MIRGILAVLAGSFLWTILWLGFHAVLASRDPQTFDGNTRVENVSLLSVILGYSVVISFVAGFATGMAARTSPIKHTVALGVLQLALGIFFEALNWHLLPVWYHLSFLALLLPGNVLGGWLAALRQPRLA